MDIKRATGLMIGIVSDLEDPDRLGRVRVTFPELDDTTSDWARLIMPMAGSGRGAFFRPEVGDEVAVGFEHGDPRRPYIFGALWSLVDPPPPNAADSPDNDLRLIQSRSGHILRFDDKSGQEKIEIIDKDGQRQVIIDSANQKIQVIAQSGDVEISAAAGTVKVDALKVEVKASSTMTLEATGVMTIKGSVVNINS
jgi:uncharacterized protein involved in type VI secretion and phage assembly